MNNLRQISTALHRHHDLHLAFPSNGGSRVPRQRIPDIDGNPFIVRATFQPPLGTAYYGVGDPALAPRDQRGSYAFSILPLIDEMAIYKERAWYRGVRIYACPERRPPDPQLPVDDEFGIYYGGGWRWGKTDYAANPRAIWGGDEVKTLAYFTDGIAHTILVGEKALSPDLFLSSWLHDEPFFLGQHEGVFRVGLAVLKDMPGISFKGNWGSAHSAGAHFIFADGSVRLLQHGTSPEEMRSLLTPNRGD
jgi:hypothetical protein